VRGRATGEACEAGRSRWGSVVTGATVVRERRDCS